MKTIVLTIPIIPKAQKRDRITARGGYARSYKDSAQSAYEAKVRALIDQHRPERPYTGEIRLDVLVCFPIPASWSKKKKQTAVEYRLPHTTKPDGDNCLKNCLDILTGIFWHDDRQITRMSVTKQYSIKPGWLITIWAKEETL